MPTPHQILGEPVSMLFVADGKEMQLIGFNRQIIAPTLELPYRYAGAVGNVKLPDAAAQTFCDAAKKLTTAMCLRGVNSLDAVLNGNALNILELNPRLSASFELYPNIWNAHIQGCNGKLIVLPRFASSRTKVTIFADAEVEIENNFAWPSWVADIPSNASIDGDSAPRNILIQKDAPICTVLAEAETADLAFIQVMQRAKQLKEMMSWIN